MQVPKNFVAEPYEYHQEIEFEIESLTNLGLGLGRLDGWVVMVPYVLPGERVRARVFRNFTNYSEADLVDVLEPSADRVAAKCSLFTRCGGCQYQHIEYTRQLQEKRRQVAEIMEKVGGLSYPVEMPCGSPQPYQYRSKLTPHYNRPSQDGQQPIGFLHAARRQLIVDVEQCPIAMPSINEALPEARVAARRAGGKKRRQRGGTLLLRSVMEGVVQDPQAIVTERVGDLSFQFKAGEFFQNNPYILPQMVSHVVEEAVAAGSDFLVDAYCGVGLFALSAASHFQNVAGVEISEPAVRWAQANAHINGIKNTRFVIGKAEAIFTGLKFDAQQTTVIIDPPRKGCDESFRQQLIAYEPRCIVYVSCDPATQARDLKEFVAAGYQIKKMQPFDLFPHTRHIENVVSLVWAG